MDGKPLEGLLLVDKPKAWTSHDVVAKVRAVIKAQTDIKVKVGHTGTLDPMATGLMILVIGSYTKRAAEFSKLDKTYEAEITLGQTSTTADAEGDLTHKSDKKPSLSEVKEVLKSFVGQISQTPPAYSAIKIDGQRAYKLARDGKTPDIQPRQVKIFSIGNIEDHHPKLKFATQVSSGTYIRSLAEDIGNKLATGAYLSELRRLSIDKYSVNMAKKIDKISLSDIIKL